MAKYQLDALVAPTGGPAWLIDLGEGDDRARSYPGRQGIAAVAGYPHITVPAGYIRGLPVGISFVGRAWSEPTLIKLAYAYEQATKHRRPPTFAPTAQQPQQTFNAELEGHEEPLGCRVLVLRDLRGFVSLMSER